MLKNIISSLVHEHFIMFYIKNFLSKYDSNNDKYNLTSTGNFEILIIAMFGDW